MDSQCDSWSGRGVSVHARKVGKDNLQFLKLWDSIPEDEQKKIEAVQEEIVTDVANKMAKARAARKKKYENIPRVLVCTKCKSKINIVPSIIVKKLEKLNLTIEKYTEGFICTVCRPVKRGRKANPKNAPQDLVCKCGKKITYPLNYIKKVAEKKGKTVEEIIKGYKCQVCSPTKGRNKKEK